MSNSAPFKVHGEVRDAHQGIRERLEVRRPALQVSSA